MSEEEEKGNECSFCGGDQRSLVTTSEGIAICEICCRNILTFFENRREAMVEHWENEPEFGFIDSDDNDNLH